MTSEMIINCLVNEGGLENLGDLVLSKSMRGTGNILGDWENLGGLGNLYKLSHFQNRSFNISWNLKKVRKSEIKNNF